MEVHALRIMQTYSVEDIIKSDVCNLIEETGTGRKKVGEGFIRPFLSKIGTLLIPSDEYVVQLTRVDDFSAVYEDGSVDSESSPEPSSGTTGLLSNFLRKTFPWKIARIQRVRVLHNFRKPIGTAILLGRLSDACKESGQSGSDIVSSLEDSNQFPMAASGSAGDHNNLAVICDLQIFPNRPELKSLRYTFFEWYDMPFLKRFKPMHFPTGTHEPPKILNANDLASCRALFSNLKWIFE